ncbi:heavy-metal-associated domain-containing protein [Glutamicibacter protophormiae]|uniref:heavy-metal-associated domain-containing protein n=1 Tax=Glutamicibacter protophormiae TaxID=37930 RepID=UPI002A7EC8AD|nr:heavy-metal-associated domain-containing protein [Glutamicibacter protophormiae]WPR64286.1 heavy-metal-associated domain-containing protein [Glutamicibacter protophormiae]WPR67779.1 heavy-metal-associated domain-containing protein [Glutamicibacter protophormiae]
MSHNCNCGCSSNNAENGNNLLQIVPRPDAAPSVSRTKIQISGMTCGHCVASVTEELKEIDGVNDVEVILNASGISTATVSSSAALNEETIKNAIDEAGYTVEAINA